MSSIFGVFNSDDSPAAGTDYTVWADASLYYRDDLCRALGIKPDDAADDADLILAAYQKWGENCVDHLHGDFAFAILNPASNSLFCARDHFGMRPFYYHHAGTRIVFASDARDIFAVPDVPYAINEGRVADFIVPELEWIDYTSTFYEDVYRLAPGHKVTVTSKGLQVREYWEPSPGPKLGPMTDHDWRDGFLEVFTRAVDQRLHVTSGTVGSTLSGGIDSGSVAAVANELVSSRGCGPLRTYSAAQAPSIPCAESSAIRLAIDALGTNATIIDPQDMDSLSGALMTNVEEPFDNEFMFLKCLYLAAQSDQISVVLDGAASDIVFNEGSYTTRLIQSGRIAEAFTEISAQQTFWGTASTISEFVRAARVAVLPEVLTKHLRKLRYRSSCRKFMANSLISSDFAVSAGFGARCERMRQLFPGTWKPDYATEVISKIRPNVTAGRERYARIAASAGVEARDPFLDRRLVDFCSRIPGHLRLHNGWPKWLLRDAMANRLPDTVRWARGKPHIGWLFNAAFSRNAAERGELTLDSLRLTLAPYLDMGKLEHAWAEFQNGGQAQMIHSAYILSQWIENSATRPVVNNQVFR